MKSIIISALVFALLFSSVIAVKYDYPDVFIKNGKLDAVIVVGNQAPASDVIAQSNLIQYFIGYGVSTAGSAKLSSEISAIDQNMILIGGACNNPLTAQILGNPQPCNEGIQPGKPLIKLFRNSIYFHLVVAGYTEKDTRDAVNSLADYDEFELNEKAETEEEQDETVKNDSINVTRDMEDEKSRLIEELNSRMADKSRQENKDDGSTEDQATETTKQNTTISIPPAEKNDPENIIIRLIDWIKSLFG